MDTFKNLKLEDEIVTGIYNFQGENIAVEFDLEEDDLTMEDFSELIKDAENWIKSFSAENLNTLKAEIAKELTDSATQAHLTRFRKKITKI